jgi:hypothetical protein
MTSIAPLPDSTSDFGDFVSTEEEELDLEEVVEPWHKYDIKEKPNVLYPICLREVLKVRYLIDHKLSFDGGSSVWMAYDLRDKRDVALIKSWPLKPWLHKTGGKTNTAYMAKSNRM